MTFMNEVENKVEEEVDVEGAVAVATSVLTQCLQERSGVRALPTCKYHNKIHISNFYKLIACFLYF